MEEHHPEASPQADEVERDLPLAATLILSLCAVVSTLTAFAVVVCMLLDGLGVMHTPLALILVLGAVFVAGVLVVPLLIAVVWSIALAAFRAERPVRTAFKGVFGFIHQAMQVVSIPFVP